MASVRPSSPPRSLSEGMSLEPEVLRCDACDSELTGIDEESCGKGVFLWVRGDERRYDEVPLCPSCGAAIGMAALARFAMEEEEG